MLSGGWCKKERRIIIIPFVQILIHLPLFPHYEYLMVIIIIIPLEKIQFVTIRTMVDGSLLQRHF